MPNPLRAIRLFVSKITRRTRARYSLNDYPTEVRPVMVDSSVLR